MFERKKIETQFLRMEEDQRLLYQARLQVHLQVPHQVQARIQTPPPQGKFYSILNFHEFFVFKIIALEKK